MAKQFVLSEKDCDRIQRMLRWFESSQPNTQPAKRGRSIYPNNHRRAKVQTVNDEDDPVTLTCKLLNPDEEEVTDTIDVYSVADDDAELTAKAADDIIEVFRDINGKWYLSTGGGSSSNTRRAKVKTVNSANYTCKLLDSAGAEVGDNITVTPIQHLGSNALTGDVWPNYAADHKLSCFLDVNGSWYTTFPFDDTGDCDDE